MDKRLFDKSSNFFKKEGFYVVLFVCLCIVATAAAITARNKRTVNEKPQVVQQDSGKNTTDLAANNTENPIKQVDNALQVKNSEPSKPQVTVPKNGSAAVSQTVDTKFAKPIEGLVVRPFTPTPDIYCSVLGSYKWNVGIDIKADLGKNVVAALDGKVVKVDNDGNRDLGQYVVVDHQNGLKTVYANLDPKVSVKVGDQVKKGVTTIGKVGKTRENYADEKIGDYLHFQVLKNNDYVDPAKYVSYSAKQQQQTP